MNNWEFFYRVLYVKILHRLTMYYPFSVIWTDRWFHYNNRHASHFRHVFKTFSEANDRDYDISIIDNDQNFFRMHYIPDDKHSMHDDQLFLNKLESELKLPENTLYLRHEKSDLLRSILVPVEVMEELKDIAEKHPLW